MEKTSGIPLSLTSPNIWKGTNKSNGQLELIHNYHLKVSCSGLTITAALQAELTAAGKNTVPFGNGVFYDRYIKSTRPNHVYAGIPTAANAVPKLAGIVCYDPAIGSLQPVNNDGITPYNKFTIVKRGFLRYKTAKNGVAGARIAYADINDATMFLFIENSTGDPIFAAPTGYGSVAFAGITAAQAAALSTSLQNKNITLPAFADATTVAEVITALSGVSVAVAGVTEAIANAVAAALTERAMSPAAIVPTLAGATYAGRIINLYPEDESVLVELDF